MASNITRHEALVPAEARSRFFGHESATIWLTGLSGAGKSTIGFALEHALINAGRACYVLDGDNVRHGLNKDLGFSPEDRAENIRRIAEVAHLLNDAGLMVITAFISPYRADRAMACEIIGADRFIEVHVATDLAVCEQRDPKGLYAKARAGKIPDFTGISAPYEAPDAPRIVLDTASFSVEACVASILEVLRPRILESKG
ncbi:adenylyl-sulfate kinase [Uliginosibacterium sp. 31-16]|uniref:adenylyl-sulfate kinase n=1 Tax=Uliginosibacterium sp. 31-16 TaxID=3068315 RepID=UPI00273F9953|nr:adenylyl-sulfate kinase [Uliginosibacterium sp. 31-16]MDP5241377.1 adenylyl-sulfate kinase [Uliginosibacterium sp. 31-16]